MPPPVADFRVICLLLAMLHHSLVRAAAARCGPDLFEDRAAQNVARYIITSDRKYVNDLRGPEATKTAALIAAMEQTTPYAETVEEGLRFLRLQTDHRFRPLLITQFSWAIRALEAGWPLPRILRELNEAVDITLGITPFDPHDSWSNAA